MTLMQAGLRRHGADVLDSCKEGYAAKIQRTGGDRRPRKKQSADRPGEKEPDEQTNRNRAGKPNESFDQQTGESKAEPERMVSGEEIERENIAEFAPLPPK